MICLVFLNQKCTGGGRYSGPEYPEYSGIKFGFFYMSEYAHMVLVSSLMVIFFFGGGLPMKKWLLAHESQQPGLQF